MPNPKQKTECGKCNTPNCKLPCHWPPKEKPMEWEKLKEREQELIKITLKNKIKPDDILEGFLKGEFHAHLWVDTDKLWEEVSSLLQSQRKEFVEMVKEKMKEVDLCNIHITMHYPSNCEKCEVRQKVLRTLEDIKNKIQ